MASWGESCKSVRWIKRTQCTFSESFLSVFILGYTLFRHNPVWASNIALQIPQEQSYGKASWEESCNPVKWSNRTQRSFSENLFPVFNGRYFLFIIAHYGFPNITLQIPQEQSYRKTSWGESCNSVRWTNRNQGSFSERFFPVFNGRYFH